MIYNLVWGIAWFAFMREEWQAAATAIGRPMPWTAEIWMLMGILALPIGAAIAAYAASPARTALKASLHASIAAWVVLSLGMAGSCSQFSMRIIVVDCFVNLIAVLAASVVTAWSLPSECRR